MNGLKQCDFDEKVIGKVVNALCVPEEYIPLAHKTRHHSPMPSVDILREIMELIRSIIFPGYYGASEVKQGTLKYYVGAAVDKITCLLTEQVKRGFCFDCPDVEYHCRECDQNALSITEKFMKQLPEIRNKLSTDVTAAFRGDPAAKSPGEAIFCYPSIRALTNFRVAHELYELQVPVIPRILTELAHSGTGIDIHPGANIGKYFFMDHGTGIVIGETCKIGENVRIYQGVTLGAKSFPADKDGNPIKGIPRHPILEDDVTVYSGATLLGRITIGKGAVIGGNVWLTRDVSAGKKIMQHRVEEKPFENGLGI